MSQPHPNRAGEVWRNLSLVLSDDAGITKINRLYLNSAQVTDVISFRLMDGLAGPGCLSGELFVNVECAVREGAQRWSVTEELALYIAHGCDHLAGAQDNSPQGRASMRRRELRWLHAARQNNLLDILKEPENPGKKEQALC